MIEGLIARFRQGLSRTRKSFSDQFLTLLSGRRALDAQTLEELEAALISADLGVSITQALLSRLQEQAKQIRDKDAARFVDILKQELLSMLIKGEGNLEVSSARPFVILVVGVNGVGKTTTIGKLAARFHGAGKNVLLAACDTFRAAAIDQLVIWGERVKADVIRHQAGADSAAVAHDAVSAAVARKTDVLMIDTAGRLHTKKNLMEELKKVERVIARALPGSPHEVLLVLDASTGQNALVQARQFHEAVGVTGLILTKLDGTAKGGVIVPIVQELGLPVRFIGLGEATEDLQPFSALAFVEALFED
jgi:fused signal recognition particle receptor